MKRGKILLALLLVLSLMLCLFPATALAAPGGKRDAEEQSETVAAADAEAAEEPAEDENDADEPEEETDAEEAEAAGEDPVEETEEPVEDLDAADGGEILTVAEGERSFALTGDTVYNNGGTVYNNGGTVYNNDGTIYNNGGTVYNNAGTVYSNGGTVYNNAGTVYSNGAQVYSFAGDVEEAVIYGYYRVKLAEDYSAYVDIEGLSLEDGTDEPLVAQDAELTLTPKEGYVLTAVDASSGELTENEDGSFTLSAVDATLELALSVQPAAPVFSLEPGTYGEAQSVEITAADGAEIYYSTDGAAPDVDNSVLYEGPIKISEGMTLSAVAVAEGLAFSETARADYAIVSLSAPVFEAVEEGYTRPAALPITVSNPGSVEANITGVALEGDDAEAFSLSGLNGGSVPPGTEDAKRWLVHPAAKLEAGKYSAVAVFTFDSGETAQVKLSFQVK